MAATKIKALILMAFLTLPLICQAHDLGIVTAELSELEDSIYRLHVLVKTSARDQISAPNLPSKCIHLTPPRGRRGQNTIDFEFQCEAPLLAGDRFDLPWKSEGLILRHQDSSGESFRTFFPRGENSIPVSMASLNAGSGTLLQTVKRYFRFGGEHILQGYDHLLFVTCLLLLVNGFWMLVKTITAFTVAHSISLGLSALGLLSIPLPATEASIALSITFLAAEIIRHHRSGNLTLSLKFPWLVAFAFGLLHGLGFASALAELGMTDQEIIPALLFFNLGVEAGQLIFILSVLGIAYILRRVVQIPIRIVAMTAASLIGVVSAYWFLLRSYSLFIY